VLGHIVTVSGYCDIPVQGQINLLALKDTARDMAGAGVTDPVIPFRNGDNVAQPADTGANDRDRGSG
jgi:hypothetical protein